jgi:hypothetical protein
MREAACAGGLSLRVQEVLCRWAPAYRALFAASAQALQDLARNPRHLGATLGMLGILHTWTRTLVYHPHVHYLVPAGGLSRDGRQWMPSREKFLLPVKPLSDRFRHTLEREGPEALKELPARLWKQRWVTHCQPVGSGQHALRYLSHYVFQTATGNRRLTLLPKGRLRWPYRQSSTRQWAHVDLEPFEFLRRFLQHVLPSGFHRVRRFGWLHPAGRRAFNRVRALLHQSPVLTQAERATWLGEIELEPPDPAPDDAPSALHAVPRCPRCHQPMVWVGSWHAGQTPLTPPERAPP